MPKESLQDNFYPSCLFMRLSHERDRLYMTIVFGEQEIPTSFGPVRFGIMRGCLSIALLKGRIPYDQNRFSAPLQAAVVSELTIGDEVTQQAKTERKSGGKIKLTASLSTHAGFSVSRENKAITDQKVQSWLTRKMIDTEFQIRSQGAETCPEIIFEVKGRRPVLQGALAKEEIGLIVWDGPPPQSVEAKFIVNSDDIVLTWSDFFLMAKLIPLKAKFIAAIIKKPLRRGGDYRLCLSRWTSPNE